MWLPPPWGYCFSYWSLTVLVTGEKMVPLHSLLPGQGLSGLLLFRIYSPPLGESLAILFLVLFCPWRKKNKQNSCMPVRVPAVYDEAQQKSSNQGYLHSACASVPCWWMIAHWHLQGLFLESTLFQMCSRRGNILSQCDPGDCYTMLSTPGLNPSNSLEHMPWHISGKSHTLPKPQNLNSTCYLWHSVPLNSPVGGFREVFFLPEPIMLFSFLLSFSFLFSLHRKGSLPTMAPWIFCPPIHVYMPHTCHILSLWECISFFQSSDWFTRCSKWFDLNLAVSKGPNNPRVPLLLHHINSFLLNFLIFPLEIPYNCSLIL